MLDFNGRALSSVSLEQQVATYALIDSRRKDRIRNYLFEVAEKNLDEKITEEELRKKKEEVKLASDRIEALQKRMFCCRLARYLTDLLVVAKRYAQFTRLLSTETGMRGSANLENNRTKPRFGRLNDSFLFEFADANLGP